MKTNNNSGFTLIELVMVIVVLGVLSVMRVPVQLIPDLDVRTVTVVTRWPGASPQDVEREILVEQEEFLSSIAGIDRMSSRAVMGGAQAATTLLDLGSERTVDVVGRSVRWVPGGVVMMARDNGRRKVLAVDLEESGLAVHFSGERRQVEPDVEACLGELNHANAAAVREEVRAMCAEFPLMH